MKTTIKVLIVEDHPVMAEGYKDFLLKLSDTEPDYRFAIDIVHDCDTAVAKLNKYPYQLVFLDVRIPQSRDGKLLDGEDLGIMIRQMFPSAKIVVSTMFEDSRRLHSVMANIDPEGFLVKCDMDGGDIMSAAKSALEDLPYYSRTVLKMLKKQSKTDFVLAPIDRQILYQISIGTKTKDLPTVVPLSLAGIERRKRILKIRLNSNDDISLVNAAREMGFI